MSNNKHTGGFGKGYYIALILCAAAIGVTGFLYYRNGADREVSLENPEQVIAADAMQEQDVPAAATQNSGSKVPESTENATEPTVKKILKTAAPVSGETISGYAMETLSYNETTRDWRTHAGIDIAAEAGTPVLAAADGIVYTVFEDETMGTTVVIRHDEDYTTQYSSLSADVQVAAGDVVALGQQIGTVGATALLESAIGDHVHFSVTYRDDPMDPAEFIGMN